MFHNVWRNAVFVSTLVSFAVLDDNPCSVTDSKFHNDIDCSDRSGRRIRSVPTSDNELCEFPTIPGDTAYGTNVENAEFGHRYPYININVTCKYGYGVDGPTEINCYLGHWWPCKKMPQCVRQCHLPKDPSVEYRCLMAGNATGFRPCKEFEFSGTDVDPKCQEPIYYSPVDLAYMRCRDGEWDYIAKCIPDCGTRTPVGTPLIIDGRTVKRGEVPWHAAVYSKLTEPYEQICGGTLISNDVVLSAAHCFWDSFEGKHYPTGEYAVAAGKLYRPWNDPNDEAQYSDVKEIHLPQHYLGNAANEQADLAVVVVTSPFVYKTHVRPACLDFGAAFRDNQLQAGHSGKIAGWGLTSVYGNASQVLKVIDLPYVNTSTCIKDSPATFQGFITSDKICAGFKNGGKALCKGDSGGGLAFPGLARGTERFFLRGIVSTAPTTNNALCNANAYTTFTQLWHYEHFIKTYWAARDYPGMNAQPQAPHHVITSDIDKCVMPPYPAGGTYTTNILNARPGDIYNSNITITITCQDGYRIDGPTRIKCINGKWPPFEISKCIQETEWDSSQCKEERVPNERDITAQQLHPFAQALSTAREGGERGGGGALLAISYRGDGPLWIYLSQDQRLNNRRTLHFYIAIWKTNVYLYVSEAGVPKKLKDVTATIALAYSPETRVALTLSTGSLEMRIGNASTPLLVSRDARLMQVMYVGFSTLGNSQGYASFKYGC